MVPPAVAEAPLRVAESETELPRVAFVATVTIAGLFGVKVLVYVQVTSSPSFRLIVAVAPEVVCVPPFETAIAQVRLVKAKLAGGGGKVSATV